MKTLFKTLKCLHLKTSNLLKFLTLSFGLTSLVLFFIPTIQLCIENDQNHFCLSCFTVLTSNRFQLNFKGSIFEFSFFTLTKTFFFATVVLIFIGIIAIWLKKFNLSACCFTAASICPLSIIPAINELKSKFLSLKISSNRIFIEIMWPFFFLILFCFICTTMSLALISAEHLTKTIFMSLACLTLFCLAFLLLQLISFSSFAVQQLGFFKILTSSNWNPNANKFGILNMIKASVFSTIGAIVISAPIGILTAVFMSEFCSKKVLMFLNPLVELMSSVPSVVFGFVGMATIVPAINSIFANFKTCNGQPIVGDSMLAVILVLTIMVLPTIVSTSFTALKTVPKQFKEASLGLGANKTETIFKVCLPAAKKGIASGVILALGRAIGETMAVIMVAGNIVNPPKLLGTVRLLTTGIAINLSYASGLLKSVLFFMGLVLLILITTLNFLFKKIANLNKIEAAK